MRKTVSNKKLFEARFVKAIDSNTKADHCFLCGRKMSSPCYSHIVPKFILEKIAEDGRVSYGYALHKKTVHGLSGTTGINNAHTFRLICRNCDKEAFRHYEDRTNLENYESLDENAKKILLCEMAIKTRLSHINMKYRDIIARDIAHGGELGTLEKEGKAIFAERYDIAEHEECILSLKKSLKTNKNPFMILYDKTLDYETKIATQTIINYGYDLKGKKIFDYSWISPENKGKFFYLMILPLKDKTMVLFYIDKKDAGGSVQTLIDQFNALSDKDKLHFLFVSLIIHDEQFYMSPSLMQTIIKKDKKLVKLYTKTAENDVSLSDIKNFRKYNNYLLKDRDN